MSTPKGNYLRIAIANPLRRVFDYRIPAKLKDRTLSAGMRVKIPFGRQKLIGIIIERIEHTDVPESKLKNITDCLDLQPTLPEDTYQFLHWVADYYHHSIGEVLMTALPARLRKGLVEKTSEDNYWKVTSSVDNNTPATLSKAPRQKLVIEALLKNPKGLRTEQLNKLDFPWRPTIKPLIKKGLVKRCSAPDKPIHPTETITPSPAQQKVIDTVIQSKNNFSPFLLEGITGSGKTEVYLRIIDALIQTGSEKEILQALVLLPEIGLTPQMVQRFKSHFGNKVVAIHSGLNETERFNAWYAAKTGQACVIIGTRSAIFTPLLKPAVIIVDEEHDLSFKQQDNLRYSARDLAIYRANQWKVPVVLGTATPSLESLYNVQQKRYQHLQLSERISKHKPPKIRMIDVRGQRLTNGLSPTLLSALSNTLTQGQQSILFINRRGFAPVLMCHSCGWSAQCKSCDTHMTWHNNQQRLRCHHCGAERHVPAICPDCNEADLHPLGRGTERIENALITCFPTAKVVRIDRDSTRKKGAFEDALKSINQGEADILVGTQMLAKGHHFPNVTLVGILDADSGLFSTDFRASERLAQLLVQVSGRAGRGEQAGTVMVQTHHPEHPLLQTLTAAKYPLFSQQALLERQQAMLPPYAYMALLRAEATNKEHAQIFLNETANIARALNSNDVEILGPVPAPMEKRAGRFRMQLLLQSTRRKSLHQLLESLIHQLETLPSARKTRWSIDIDPQEMY